MIANIGETELSKTLYKGTKTKRILGGLGGNNTKI